MQNVDGYAMLLFRFRPCLLSPVYVLRPLRLPKTTNLQDNIAHALSV